MDPFTLIGLAINFIPFFSGNGMVECSKAECNAVKTYYSSIYEKNYTKVNSLIYKTSTDNIKATREDIEAGSNVIKSREGIKNILFQIDLSEQNNDFMFDDFITLPFIIEYNNGQTTKQNFTLMKDNQQWKILVSN